MVRYLEHSTRWGGGVEFGIDKDTRIPVVIDRFNRENSYAMLTVGDPGSEKSFTSKLACSRRWLTCPGNSSSNR